MHDTAAFRCRHRARPLALLAWGVVTALCAGAWPAKAICAPSAATDATSAPLSGDTRSQRWEPVLLPEETLFGPLVADPKELHFYASFLPTRAESTDRSANLASIGFGENFGVWGTRDRLGGWQFGIQAGVLAQLNLDPATSYALINADYTAGLTLAWRRDPVAVRMRLYHQSSHLGDEYLLENPGVKRINVSFEELETIVAYSLAGGRGRVYGGGGLLVHRYPAMNRGRLQCGAEWRKRNARVTAARRERLAATPVVAVELKSLGETHWHPNVRAVAGADLTRQHGERGVTLLAEYYYGYFPYGQFFDQKVQSFGIGVHLAL
jgi:hypothetical protein